MVRVVNIQFLKNAKIVLIISFVVSQNEFRFSDLEFYQFDRL